MQKSLSFKCFILTSSLLLTILLSLSKVEAAINAKTSKEINGSLPYITFNGGQTKETKLISLLTIKLADGRAFIPENDITMIYPNAVVDTSSARSPIEVPVENNHFYDVITFVPLSSGNGSISSIELGTLLSSNYFWRDDDSDGDFSATGQVTLKWQDSSGADVSAIAKEHPEWGFDPCQSPYRLTISVTNSDFSTRYGLPNIGGNVVGSSHTYYFRSKVEKPYVCFARPNIFLDSTTGGGLPDLNGATWFKGHGFVPQDVTGYGAKNFPNTGANNMFFDLILAGVTAQQVLDGYSDTNGVILNNGGGWNLNPVKLQLSISPNQDIETGNKLRVTLKGPTMSKDGKLDLLDAFLYSTYAIDYKTNATNTRLYNFGIGRWYVIVPKEVSFNDALCVKNLAAGIGYYVPKIIELTNANAYSWNGGIPGRNINYYRRQFAYDEYTDSIIGGFFNEWGSVSEESYPGSGWYADAYITQTVDEHGQRYYVSSRDGSIIQNDKVSGTVGAVCVAPIW